MFLTLADGQLRALPPHDLATSYLMTGWRCQPDEHESEDEEEYSGAVRGHPLLHVGDGALEGLYMVALRLADDLLDGAGYGVFDSGGR
jgi:hypothetical protein